LEKSVDMIISEIRTDSRIYYGMLCDIWYQRDDREALEAGRQRLFEEIPKILEEWPHYVQRLDSTNLDLLTWLDENCSGRFQFPGPMFEGDNYKSYIIGILFKEETDVMAFKLVWS